MLTVTRLEPQKRNPQRLNVYLDGEFAFGISRAAAPWLEIGRQITKQEIIDLQEQDQLEAAYQRALNFLSYRMRSEKEIHQNLTKHDVSEPIINRVLEKLRTAGLVDDREFSRTWVENRSRFKPRGKKALQSELYQKGIPPELIEEALSDLDEPGLALKSGRQKMPGMRDLDQTEFTRKMSGYLNRRGFSYGIINDTLPTLWQEYSQQSVE